MKRNVVVAVAAGLALVVAPSRAEAPPPSPAAAGSGDAFEPYPVEYWALRPVIQNVQVSPDGERLAFMRISSRDGDPVVEIYDAKNLQEEPFRLNADPMEIDWFSWVSDKHLLFGARQQVRKVIKGFNQGVWRGRLGMLDVAKKKVGNFSISNCVGIESILPTKPYKVIVSVAEGPSQCSGGGKAAAFRPAAYYELDLEKSTKKLLIRGTMSRGAYVFDIEGNARLARGFDESKDESVWYHRKPGAKKWKEYYRRHEDSFDSFGVLGFDVDRRENLFVRANNGHDTAGLWALNVDTGSMKLIDRRKDVDLWGVLGSSQQWTDPNRVVGFYYMSDRLHRHYIDEIAGATHEQLMNVVPNAHNVAITSRSRDGMALTVINEGPRDPGTYYFLKDGRFQKIGSRQPLLEREQLADVEYITYKARDGKQIAAYVTVPRGKPPFPLVVMPHGGPFVAEYVSYDPWGQLLANNGYMVLQPQYRGSRNYGQQFYQAAFLDPEGGQGGYKMQDDKDDGAKHLVKIGRVDPDRMAMVGWSYGGYAAGIAASRTPQIYQCVVAGAAVFDPLQQVNYYRHAMRGRQEIEQVSMWDDSVSPIKEVAKVNVPMLIVHGDVDQRVPVEHARKYTKDLDQHGKFYKYVELAGADHWLDTLSFDHRIDFYTAMIDFLAKDCGPDGL